MACGRRTACCAKAWGVGGARAGCGALPWPLLRLLRRLLCQVLRQLGWQLPVHTVVPHVASARLLSLHLHAPALGSGGPSGRVAHGGCVGGRPLHHAFHQLTHRLLG